MDADVVVKELGLAYMKGDYAHAGEPRLDCCDYSNNRGMRFLSHPMLHFLNSTH